MYNESLILWGKKMTKVELHNYIKEHGSDYYMVTWDGHTEPLYFMPYNGTYFESPLEVRRCQMTEEELWEYVKFQYLEKYLDESFEREKKNLIDGYWYEIDCPQCTPFLPFEIDDVYPISEEEYLRQVAEKWQ